MSSNTKKSSNVAAKPAPKSNAKPAPAKPAPAPAALTSAATVPTGEFTVAAFAAELKTDAYDVRKALRAIGAKKPGSRWIWPSRSAVESIRAKVAEQLGIEIAKKAAKK